MNKFVEMIQKGEEIIARTNELLANDLDLNVAGTVDIATYLSDLKAVHADSLAFTDEAVMADLVAAKGNMSQEEYFGYLARFSNLCGEISGVLRDRIYDRTSKYDIAFNNKNELYRFHNETITSLNGDINAYNRDLARIDRKITRLRDRLQNNSNLEVAAILNEQIQSLEDEREEVQAKKEEKLAKIEEHKEAQKRILYGGPAVVVPVRKNIPEQIDEVEETPQDEEHLENPVLPEGEEERPELPEEIEEEEELPELPEEDEEEEELPELPKEDEEEEGLIPAFPGLDDEEEEELPELPEEVEDDEVEEELPELPEEIEDEEELPELPEEGEEIDPNPTPTDDEEEVEVINHTEAKPSLLKRIHKVILAAIAFLSVGHLVEHGVHHFNVDHSALEDESQLDEDDLEDVPDQTEPEDEKKEDVTPDGITPEEEKPEEEKPEEEKPEEEKPEEEMPEIGVAPLPAELAEYESIVDRETGMEVTHTGDTYLHQGDVTIEQEDRDLYETDHGTTIVTAEDIVPDQKLPELTGDEQTYEEAVQNMTDEEVADLDAAIAEWAASFDASQLDGSSLTLTP